MNAKGVVVKAGHSAYPVYFDRFRRRLQPLLKGSNSVVVVSNPTVFALHGPAFIDEMLDNRRYAIEPILMGDGERFKSQRTVNRLYDHLLELHVNRHDAIIALGGGVVGDTAGFVAATYKRGIHFIQVPTTLLAMVDSSIGGKVGINHARGKNLVGAFYQPQAVLVNPDYLATLGQREMVEGTAEILKACFLSDRDYLRTAADLPLIYEKKDQRRFAEIIGRSIRFKARIVARDPYDSGLRQILNFGHTFGHAIEKVEGFRRYHHGEAVLAGMAAALYLSSAMKLLSKRDRNEGLRFLAQFVSHLKPLSRQADHYLAPMAVDKKRTGETVICVMLEGFGKPVVRAVRSRKQLLESIKFMIEFVDKKGAL
jgi:3-dehydroquinate synthase